jgi:hypothetical protein
MKTKQEIHKRDKQGRPVDVTFKGDAEKQCPACLSKKVEQVEITTRVIAGDDWEGIFHFRRMHCKGCGGFWWKVA